MEKVSHKNVRASEQFQYSQLGLSQSEISKYEKQFQSPEDFLMLLRVSPMDTFGKSVYEIAKEIGYIRTDGLNISLALWRLYDTVTKDSERYIYIRSNKQYERLVSMPEDTISDILDFIWKYPGGNNMRPLSGNEKQILFDYFAISRDPIKEKTLPEIGQEYYYEQRDKDPEEMAANCLNNALGKLRGYGKDFTKLFEFDNHEGDEAMEARIIELKKLLDVERESKIRDLLTSYQSACRHAKVEPSYEFVDICYVILDSRVRRILIEANVENLQQLIEKFNNRDILKIAEYNSPEYRIIRNHSRNFFYRYLLRIPECIR